MSARVRFALALATFALFISAPLVLSAVFVWTSLDEGGQQALRALVAPYLPLVVMVVALVLLAGGAFLRGVFQRYVGGLMRIAEAQQLMLVANPAFRFATDDGAPPEFRAIERSANALADQRDALRDDIDAQITRARQSIEEERNRLATLMSELSQSVVVCNLDGRILLYNGSARQQFRAMSQAPEVADGGELIGLGRSIYAVFDRSLVAHALETIQHGLRRGAAETVASFITTCGGGQLLRVRMSPVLSRASAQNADLVTADGREGEMTGFILMLDNITSNFENESRRDQMLHTLTEGNRAGLANVRVAAEMLEYPDLDEALQTRFRGVIRDEVKAMSERLDETANAFTDTLKSRWPLEEMLGADLVEAAQRRVEARLGVPIKLEEIDPDLWVRVDSFSLLQALVFLVGKLSEEFDVREVRFRLAPAGRHAQLDLIWAGHAMSSETVVSWELESMSMAGEHTPLTVRDVVERHGGEMWLEREKVRHRAFFRLLLPAAPPREAAEVAPRAESRPEYYDFDLFSWSEKSRALDERPLTELTYTAFDTETTGLDPSAGDEIIQIGAARIVNGKLLRNESFEQLIDPRRPLHPESTAIHGIQPEMLLGQPTIDKVLPAFHAFADDTVLIAHNAAFDMRFLQIKESLTGLRFDQPVLDTLLLSALLHPNQTSHTLDAIAARLNLTIVGRHTALGDAIVTAEIFIRMIPLLAEQGIFNLRQAREAAQKTFYARIRY